MLQLHIFEQNAKTHIKVKLDWKYYWHEGKVGRAILTTPARECTAFFSHRVQLKLKLHTTSTVTMISGQK